MSRLVFLVISLVLLSVPFLPLVANVHSVGSDQFLLYSVDSDLNLVATNATTMETNVIGHVGYGVESLCFSKQGVLFATADLWCGLHGSADTLIRIDPSTGSATVIGSIGFGDVEGIAFDANGTLLGVDTHTDKLIRIDPRTGLGSAVGDVGFDFIVALAFSPQGILYGIGIPDGRGGESTLLTIDPLTGSASAIGPIGFNTTEDISFSQEGLCYGVSILFGGGTGDLITIDLITGAGSAIGKMGSGEFEGLAAYPPFDFTPPEVKPALYCVDTDLNLVAVNPTTLEVEVVGYVGYGVEALCFSEQGILFGATDLWSGLHGSADTLITIDAATGAPSIVGSIGFGDVEGIAFDANGTLYGVDTHTDKLITIDAKTGGGTVIGDTGFDFILSLAFSSDGVLYGISIPDGGGGESTLLRINVTTGLASVIGPIGFSTVEDISFTQGGVMYGYSIYLGGGTGDLITIDLSTGTGSAVGKMGLGDFEGLAIYPPLSFVPGEVETTLEISPSFLMLGSSGKWTTAFLEFLNGYDVASINVSSLMLNGTIPAELTPTLIGDFDNDTIPDLMIKFDRATIEQRIVNSGSSIESPTIFTMTMQGELSDEVAFRAKDTIKAIMQRPRGVGRGIFAR